MPRHYVDAYADRFAACLTDVEAWLRASRFRLNPTKTRVASLWKEMNFQGKANGRKVVVFGIVWNLQGTENARKDKLESASKGNCKEWNLDGN